MKINKLKYFLCTCFMLFFLMPLQAKKERTLTEHDNIKDTLIIGIDKNKAPYSFFSKEKITGFYIDVTDTIMHLINQPYKYEILNTNDLQKAFQEGTIDLIISNIAEINSFDSYSHIISHTIHQSTLAILSRKEDELLSLNDLKESKIYYIKSSFELKKHNYFYNLNIEYKDNYLLNQIEYKLNNKEYDAIIISADILSYIQQKNSYNRKNYTLSLIKPLPILIGYSFNIKKDQTKYQKIVLRINKVILALREQNYLHNLSNKWLYTGKEIIQKKSLRKQFLFMLFISICIFVVIICKFCSLLSTRKKLREHQHLFLDIIDKLPISIQINDYKGIATYRNKTAKETFNWNNIVSTNNSIESSIKFKDTLEKLKQTQKNQKVSLVYNLKDNTLLEHDLNLIPILLSNKPHILIVGIDVHDYKEAKRMAERSEKMKSNFIANMSHDIRTPLNSVLSFTELLTETQDKTEFQEYCEIIEQNNNYLLYLLEDLINLAKVQSGDIEEHNIRWVDGVTLLHEMEREFKDSITKKGEKNKIKIIVNNPYKKIRFKISINNFKRLTNNLLTNAVKFTDEGEIEFGFIYKDSIMTFYVQDTGRGIDSEHQEKLFIPFNRFETDVEGSGLGLATCKGIIDALHGDIGVISEKGKGSLFFIRVSLETEIEIDDYDKWEHLNAIHDKILNEEKKKN